MQTQAARISTLQRMPLFGGIRDDVLAFLLGQCTEVAVARGALFFCQGEAAESMFVLESGSVEVRQSLADGESVLCRLGPGACFGEMALIDLGPRSATVQALEDCRAVEIFAASLFRLYERDLEQFALIQMNIARELSRRLRIADMRPVPPR
ncbi:MAG TPA: cyclic nucleotide-binding domain-containing protein [Rhodocyclaceae bacterium]|nr:cyclic nucleotide-binding domain-containing protein [Rhodocyclaceae bacterium]